MEIGGITLVDFKIYCKAIVNQTVWYGGGIHAQTSEISQCPEIDPEIYGQFIFDKDAKAVNRERKIFSTNCARITGCPFKEKN